MKKIIFSLSLLIISSCANTQSTDINSRTINEEDIKQMTWFILFQKDPINWVFKFKQKDKENEYDIISKKFDLSYYEDREIYVEWKIIDKFLEITEIKDIKEEREVIIEPYNLTNNIGWYSILVDEDNYKAIKWGNKTMVKNNSWELILSILIFNDNRHWNEPLISDDSKQFALNWIKWERRESENWFEMWLVNQYYKQWNLINLKANYWTNIKYNKKIILQILNSFRLIPKKIEENISCWGRENKICPNGYICELRSNYEFSSGKCTVLE